jgi:hypothetical protein
MILTANEDYTTFSNFAKIVKMAIKHVTLDIANFVTLDIIESLKHVPDRYKTGYDEKELMNYVDDRVQEILDIETFFETDSACREIIGSNVDRLINALNREAQWLFDNDRAGYTGTELYDRDIEFIFNIVLRNSKYNRISD